MDVPELDPARKCVIGVQEFSDLEDDYEGEFEHLSDSSNESLTNGASTCVLKWRNVRKKVGFMSIQISRNKHMTRRPDQIDIILKDFQGVHLFVTFNSGPDGFYRLPVATMDFSNLTRLRLVGINLLEDTRALLQSVHLEHLTLVRCLFHKGRLARAVEGLQLKSLEIDSRLIESIQIKSTTIIACSLNFGGVAKIELSSVEQLSMTCYMPSLLGIEETSKFWSVKILSLHFISLTEGQLEKILSSTPLLLKLNLCLKQTADKRRQLEDQYAHEFPELIGEVEKENIIIRSASLMNLEVSNVDDGEFWSGYNFILDLPVLERFCFRGHLNSTIRTEKELYKLQSSRIKLFKMSGLGHFSMPGLDDIVQHRRIRKKIGTFLSHFLRGEIQVFLEFNHRLSSLQSNFINNYFQDAGYQLLSGKLEDDTKRSKRVFAKVNGRQ